MVIVDVVVIDVDVDVDAATNATAVAVTSGAVTGQTTGLNQFDGAWKLKLLLQSPGRQVRHRAREMAPLDVPRALLDGEKVVKWDDVSTSFKTQHKVNKISTC